LQCTKKTSKT